MLMEYQITQPKFQRTLDDFKFHSDPRWHWQGVGVAFCIRWGTPSQWHMFVQDTLGM